MIEVKQTVLHEPENGDIGNCLQACFASILELNIDDVPHFAAHRQSDWFDRMNDWFLQRGLWVLYINHDFGFTPFGYSIVCGTSPRGIRHSCVAYDGQVVFDPHPDNTGLKEIDSYYLLVTTQTVNKGNDLEHQCIGTTHGNLSNT